MPRLAPAAGRFVGTLLSAACSLPTIRSMQCASNESGRRHQRIEAVTGPASITRREADELEPITRRTT
jgi:hypothetical protein